MGGPERAAIDAALKTFKGADERDPADICKGIVQWVFKAPGHPEYLRGDNDKGTKYTSVVSIFRADKREARRMASKDWIDIGTTRPMFNQSRSLAETDPIAHMQRQGIERDRLAALRDSS